MTKQIPNLKELIAEAFCVESAPPEPDAQKTPGIDYDVFLRERYRTLCQELEENRKKSERYRIALLAGLRAGESRDVLLLGAAKAISLMTRDGVFYDAVERAIEQQGNTSPTTKKANV